MSEDSPPRWNGSQFPYPWEPAEEWMRKNGKPTMKFRKKPEVVEARQLSASTREKISKWINGGESGKRDQKMGLKAWYYDSNVEDELYIDTVDGTRAAGDGDWIAKDARGRLHIYPASVFAELFEAAE